jgi:5'-phosphate synthase pdxT subunit
VAARLVRKPENLEGVSALILPGGESTVISLLLEKYGLFDRIQALGRDGLPMFGTCAGAILLGRGEGRPRRLELAPVELRRNAYGRQIDSFSTAVELAPFQEPFRCVFIRAPKIVLPPDPSGRIRARGPSGPKDPEEPGEAAVRILGEHGGAPVLVAVDRLLLGTFHPELTDDLRVHRYFVETFVASS